jgi:catechol 2,3-dioxygenase-like lactoylglutathione lyase family enzyme
MARHVTIALNMAVTGISYVAVWSKDLAANRHVFANVLELPIAYEDDDIVVFETDGAQLVLQRAIGADEHLDGTVQFGFHVGELDTITKALQDAKQTIELNQEDIGMKQRVTVLRLPSGQSVEFIGE